MAIVATLVDSGSSASTPPYTTNSLSFGANELLLVFFTGEAFSGNTPPVAAVTGSGITVDTLDAIRFGPAAPAAISAHRSLPGSFSSTLTIDTTGSTCISGVWHVVKVTGMDTSGTNGSGAIVQVVKNATAGGSPNSLTLTLAALGDATNNAVIAAFSNDGGEAITEHTGYTELGDTQPNYGLESQYKTPGTTTVTASLGDFRDTGGIAIEIKAAAAAGGAAGPLIRGGSLLHGALIRGGRLVA